MKGEDLPVVFYNEEQVNMIGEVYILRVQNGFYC